MTVWKMEESGFYPYVHQWWTSAAFYSKDGHGLPGLLSAGVWTVHNIVKNFEEEKHEEQR